jgi:formylmethanofuran dehydrogenase subunit D
MGMQVQYLKKAKTDLVAECNIGEPDWDSIDKLDIDVYVKDEKGQVVVAAVISMKVGDKPA